MDISEDAEIIRSLITILYPIPSEVPGSSDKILALLAATQKYEMNVVQSSIRAEVFWEQSPTLKEALVFRGYAIASRAGLRPEMVKLALLTLGQPMTFRRLGAELRLFEGQALRELAGFREQCRDHLTLYFKSFLDISNGPSKIWVGCPGKDEPKGAPPALPHWLNTLFTDQIDELKHAFTRPLIKPSSICEKYLEALQKHCTPDVCTFCAGVHVMKGEQYSGIMKNGLIDALAKASFAFVPWENVNLFHGRFQALGRAASSRE